nr:hypothetical protein CPGR_00470 [Mycolicibacterium fortuitum subsp. fortuitum DSM 46621 = ATCC 6841 = JCM 6387]
MGRPNCWRCLQYSTVSASTLRMPPTASAHTAAAPSSRARSSDGQACPSAPSSAEAGTRTSENVRSEARRSSTVRYGCAVNPVDSEAISTRKREIPEVSARSPEVRAVTSRWVASGALTAINLVPSITHSSPSRRAVVDTSRQLSPEVGSVAASATMAEPATTSSSRAAAAASPERCSRPPATTTVSTNGSITRAWPNASAMTMVSTGPPPIPPASSGRVAPRMPSSSAKPRQISGCQPAPVLAAARLDVRS